MALILAGTAPTAGSNGAARMADVVDLTSAQSAAGTKTWTGGTVYSPTSITSNTTLSVTLSPRTVNCNASSGAFTVTLPTTSMGGVEYLIIKTDASANAVTVNPGTSIAGYAGSVKLPRQYDSILVRSTATNGVWLIVGGTFNPIKPAPEHLYSRITPAAGDTLSASTGTAEQAFATTATIPANYWVPGMRMLMEGDGYFTTSAAGPNQQPRIRLGGTSGAAVVDAGSIGLTTGASNYRFKYRAEITCRSVGTSGVFHAVGELYFVAAGTGTTVMYVVGPNGTTDGSGETFTSDTGTAKTIGLTTQYSSATAGNSTSLRAMSLTAYPPSVYAS